MNKNLKIIFFEYIYNQSSTFLKKLLVVVNINKMHKWSIEVCNLDNTMELMGVWLCGLMFDRY
jgi:hypothetical protein